MCEGMKRVRRVGRDGRIGFRRREALLGDRRIVVAVDQVVGDAGWFGCALNRGSSIAAALSWFV